MNPILILLVSIGLYQVINVQAELTPEEECWGTLAQIQHPNDIGDSSNSKISAITKLIDSIKETETRGRKSTSPISSTLKAVDILLAEVPWNQRGYSRHTYPPPSYQKPIDKYNWQLVLGRLAFLTTNDWSKSCAAILQNDGICPTEDYKGVEDWHGLYTAIHEIRKHESDKNDLSKLETFRRICNEMVDDWDGFHGLYQGISSRDKPRGCRGVPNVTEIQRGFCTSFLPKFKQVLVMQLCHYAP